MIKSITSKTRSKASKGGNKLMKIVLATFRVIGRANAMYMKSMEKVSEGGIIPCPSPQHQHIKLQNISRSPCRSSLCRSSPCRSPSPSVGVGSSKSGMKQTLGESSGIVKIRNYSVGVGKIGRIDEDRACSFRALNAKDLVFHPRSKSCAAVQKSSAQP